MATKKETKAITVVITPKMQKIIKDQLKKIDEAQKAGTFNLENNSDLCKWYEQFAPIIAMLPLLFKWSKKVSNGMKRGIALLDLNCNMPIPE